MAQTLLDNTSNKFTQYPAEIDSYFINKTVTIQTFPKALEAIQEAEFPPQHITSAQQYFDYLTQEITFWQNNDKKNSLQKFSNINSLVSAKANFDNAIKSPLNSRSQLDQSVNALQNGCLYSRTKLACTLLFYVDKSSYFIEGFWSCLVGTPNNGISTVGGLDGYFAGKSYLNLLQEYTNYSAMHITEFQNNVNSANVNYTTLNKKYTESFHRHEDKIKEFAQQVDMCISDMTDKQNTFFNVADARLDKLEKLYEEKLRLQAPAKYWLDTKKSYYISGILWMLLSCAIAIVLIIFLGTTLHKVDNFLSADAEWIDNVKNSAIIAVITSISIYILRITIKMSLSSFHLSRDAKERESLSYFYLALIEKSAVTEKERAIILNALFSRSDTGLLKGEAAPTMSSNVSDLVDIFKNAK